MINIIDTTAFDIVKQTSLKIDDMETVNNFPGRTIQSTFNASIAEIGELAVEVNCETGFHYKDSGVDGVVGEAIDVMICMYDMIHHVAPNLTQQQFNEIVHVKCSKWVAGEQNRFNKHFLQSTIDSFNTRG